MKQKKEKKRKKKRKMATLKNKINLDTRPDADIGKIILKISLTPHPIPTQLDQNKKL